MGISERKLKPSKKKIIKELMHNIIKYFFSRLDKIDNMLEISFMDTIINILP